MEKLKTETENRELPLAPKKGIKSTLYVIINAFLIIALAMLSFVKINASMQIDWTGFAYEAIILWFISLVIYSNSVGIGELKGHGTDRYIETIDDCEKAVRALTAHREIDRLNDFVQYVREQDLISRRKDTIGSACIPWDKWETEYQNKTMRELRAMRTVIKDERGRDKAVPFFSKTQIAALLHAKTMRYHRFNAEMLTSPVNAKTRGFTVLNPKKKIRMLKARKALTSVLWVMTAAYFAVDIVLGFTFAAVVECAVKIIPVAWAWVTGQYAGWNATTETAVAFYANKADWCKRAVAWLNAYHGGEGSAE